MEAHALPLRIYYEDTDFSGLVYHASYLRFLERGRTELLRSAGIVQRDLHGGEDGLFFVVRRMEIDWLKPARMDDEVVVRTEVAEARGASMLMRQAVTRGDEVLLRALVTVAAVRGGRPVRLPEALRRILAGVSPADGS